MDKELDEKLVKDFPNLYRDRNGDIRNTCMSFGFECGNGWESLIRKLSSQLEALILELPEEERSSYCASQVKEKYGSLRFYMTYSTDAMDDLIAAYENISGQTCEVTGKSGTLKKIGGWYSTLCDEEYEKRIKERDEEKS